MPSVGELVKGEAKRQVTKAVTKTTAGETSEEALRHLVKTSKPAQSCEKQPGNASRMSDSEATSVRSDTSSCVFYDAVSCLSAVSNSSDSVAECSYNPFETQKAITECKHMRKIGVECCCANTISSSQKLSAPDDFIVPGLEDLKQFGGTAVNPPNYETYEMMKANFPYFVRGVVSRGFGRGSKDLGTPTANINKEAVAELDPCLLPGVYYGWAKVDPWPVMKMVMNLGWNPFFENKEKNLEVHILHKFALDFYGAHIRVAILGYIRPEAKFDNLKSLIEAIRNDADVACKMLDRPENVAYKTHSYFSTCEAQK